MKPMTKVPDLKFEPDWRRLKFVIDQSGMSEREFARFIDLSEPDLITHIRYAQCGIDQELAELINFKFPQYSEEWLLGEAEAPNPLNIEMFPSLETAEYVKQRLFKQAELEFDLTSDRISQALLRMIPRSKEDRKYELEELSEDVGQMLNLLEVMRQCVQPETQRSLSDAVGVSEKLCDAAEKFGVSTPEIR